MELPSGAEPYMATCKFFDVDLVDPLCIDPGTDSCIGAWSEVGLETLEDNVGDGFVLCRTSHFTSFGIDVDFSIRYS